MAARMIPAVPALSALSCVAPVGSSPAATASEGAVPRIKARTNRDSAGCFLTIVDIVFSFTIWTEPVETFDMFGTPSRSKPSPFQPWDA